MSLSLSVSFIQGRERERRERYIVYLLRPGLLEHTLVCVREAGQAERERYIVYLFRPGLLEHVLVCVRETGQAELAVLIVTVAQV